MLCDKRITLNNFIPTDFTEFLGGGLIAIAVIFGFLSMFTSIRSHSIKMLSLMLVAGLSIYSNHPANYFAALFIVATAVTELEFLQNLAAIIRGNKEYFSYKIETLSKEEKKESIEEEQKLDLASLSEQDREKIAREHMRDKTKLSVKRSYEAGEKALDKLEEYFGQKIERNIRIKSKNKSIEFDGIIPNVVDDMVSEKLFEIKYVGKPNLNQIYRTFEHAETLAREYKSITNKIAKMHLVLVTAEENGLIESQSKKLKSLVDKSDVSIGFSVYTCNQLGI